jgi:hypothetical protein
LLCPRFSVCNLVHLTIAAGTLVRRLHIKLRRFNREHSKSVPGNLINPQATRSKSSSDLYSLALLKNSPTASTLNERLFT